MRSRLRKPCEWKHSLPEKGFKIRVHKPPRVDSVLFSQYHRHLTALLEATNKQFPDNTARLGVKQSAGLVTRKNTGFELRNFGPLAKPVILVTCLIPLSLSSPICKVGTIAPTFPRGSCKESNEIMQVKAFLCELPFIAQTKVLLPAGHLCPWL